MTATTACAASQHATTKLRHDSIELQLIQTIRDGVGTAYRQQRGLQGADRTIPDLLIRLGNRTYLCDVTVVDTLANTHLDIAAAGPGKMAESAAKKKVDKYAACAAAIRVVHLPFAVETMGGLSKSALQLLREIHNAAASGCHWRDAGDWRPPGQLRCTWISSIHIVFFLCRTFHDTSPNATTTTKGHST